jgi:hypothetical protein
MVCSINPSTLIAVQAFFATCTCQTSKETP